MINSELETLIHNATRGRTPTDVAAEFANALVAILGKVNGRDERVYFSVDDLKTALDAA